MRIVMKAAKANERPKTLSTVATRKRRTMLSRLRDIVFISEKLYLNCLDPFSFSFLNAKKGGASFSFSFLDERKGGKRKSRHHRGWESCRRQSCALKKYPANFPALGRGPCLDERNGGKRKSRHHRGRGSCRRQSCVRKKYPANCSALGRGPFLDERKGGKRKSRHRGCLPS